MGSALRELSGNSFSQGQTVNCCSEGLGAEWTLVGSFRSERFPAPLVHAALASVASHPVGNGLSIDKHANKRIP